MSTITNNEITELEYLTKNFIVRVHIATYEECVDFVNKRADLAYLIKLDENELSQESKKRIQALSEYDSIIMSRFQELKDEAMDWLLKQGTIREQKSAYSQSYTPDSMFFDRKN